MKKNVLCLQNDLADKSIDLEGPCLDFADQKISYLLNIM